LVPLINGLIVMLRLKKDLKRCQLQALKHGRVKKTRQFSKIKLYNMHKGQKIKKID